MESLASYANSFRVEDVVGLYKSVLSNPIFWFWQIQSCLTCLGLGLAWYYASITRRRALKKIENEEKQGNSMAFVSTDLDSFSRSQQKSLPMVSVILAVKGAGEQGMANWRSQLVTLYGGKMEFLFCMESELDPAYNAVAMLRKEICGPVSGSDSPSDSTVDIRIVVAGLSNHCSQQIHNQLAGAKSVHPDSKYILFLDDDIQCHPGTIGSLVGVMESKPEVFVATGYSFDVPSQPCVSAYAAMAYRLPLLVGMSTGAQVFFVWGGCIFFRASDFRTNTHGMRNALEKNGYSNDLILTSIAGLHRRTVWSPAVAIFPGRMSGDWTFTRYWNYVRRQIFALLTYSSSYAYRVNRFGWLVYMYLAWACVFPLAFAAAQLALFLAALLFAAAAYVDSPASHPDFLRTALGTAVAAAGTPATLGLSLANVGCAGVLALCGLVLFRSVFALCNKLSPEAPQFRLRQLSLPLCVLGMAVNLFMLPIIALYTYCRADITWARIRYVRKNGVVAKVTHPSDGDHGQDPHNPKSPKVAAAGTPANLLRSRLQPSLELAAKLWSQRWFWRRTKVG